MSLDRPKAVADLVFVVDATMSMGPCIDALKNNLSRLIDHLVVGGPETQGAVLTDWRARVVGYRDFEHKPENALESHPFVTSADEIKTQLQSLEAVDGGDEPETLLDALYDVLNDDPDGDPAKKWRPKKQAHRAILIFTDASYKPQMHNPAGGKGGTEEDIYHLYISSGAGLFGLVPQIECYTEFGTWDRCLLNTYALDGKSAQVRLREISSNPAEFNKVIEILAATVSGSLTEPLDME